MLLFRVIGYLTLVVNKKLFQILYLILVFAVGIGMIEATQGSIILSAIFSIIVMAVNYKKSNDYARKQSKILLSGIGMGIVLFLAASFMPNVYLVQSGQAETEMFVELAIVPTETVMDSLPLLLFSGVSIAIIFMLLHREFALKDTRLKLKYFVVIPVYFLVIDVLLFTYTGCTIWLLITIDIMLLLPLALSMAKLFGTTENTEEQTYQWRLQEAVEKEKQELSSYLHDEVLQSLIAFYRQIQADESGRFEEMKTSLSELIAQMRNVSHNLYPTMVEDLGLEQSLYIFVAELQKGYQEITINCKYELSDGILPKHLALSFYRIIKELVNNAAKHSGGFEINFSLEEDDKGYDIYVKDNGKGFTLPKNDDLLKSPHMGIYTVKKRVNKLQGKLTFESGYEKGTEYHIFVPKIMTSDL